MKYSVSLFCVGCGGTLNFNCQNPTGLHQCISSGDVCNGVTDCSSGFDETVNFCLGCKLQVLYTREVCYILGLFHSAITPVTTVTPVTATLSPTGPGKETKHEFGQLILLQQLDVLLSL